MALNTSMYGIYNAEYYDRRVTKGNFRSIQDYHIPAP